MTWDAIIVNVSALRIDVACAELRDLELKTRATDADGRAEGAWTRLMKMAGR